MEIDLDFKKFKLSIQPQVLAGLLNLDDDSDMSFGELDRLIKSDQNIATLILKASNSSLYSRGQEIRTLQHAIAMLGFRVVRSLAMVASSKELFETGNYTRFKRLVWHHSVVTAIIARKLAGKYGDKHMEEEAFIAGLLHDIGKIILNMIDRKKFIEAITIATEENVTFADAETRVFGFNHLQIGERAVQEWNLPEIYRHVLSHHKDLEDFDDSILENKGDRLLLYIVSYANYLAKKYGYGHYTEEDDKDGEFIREKLRLSDEDVQYFESKYPKMIENDEFYKFFITLM